MPLVHKKWGVKQPKKTWTGGGEGTTLVPSQTPAQLTCQFFSPFFPYCGPWTQTIKFSMPLTFFPKESQTETLSCSWLVSKSEQKQGVRWGNSEVFFIPYPVQKLGEQGPFEKHTRLRPKYSYFNKHCWKAQATRQQNFH